MVRGLDRFSEHFAAFTDKFLLIGGTACELLFEGAGLSFRATKDLDVVLVTDALDAHFIRAFWDFIRAAGYRTREHTGTRPRLYRFLRPTDETFPHMIELFARQPVHLESSRTPTFVAITADGAASSLSAILLDEDCFAFIVAGRRTISGLPVVGAEHLVPLKALAWLDLSTRRSQGEPVDSKNVAKHRNDVFRLYQLVDPTLFPLAMPEILRAGMASFLDHIAQDPPDPRKLGLKNTSGADIVLDLRRLYLGR